MTEYSTWTRLRYDGVENYLATQLEAGSGSISFARPLTRDGGVLVGTLAANTYLPMSILDANYVLREIVYLIAYAGGTTGTIARGQEGTGDRVQAIGSKVVHASTAEDFLSVLAHNAASDAHHDTIVGIANGIAQELMTAHLAHANPHPQYMLKTGGNFDGDVTINNLTVTGTLLIPKGAKLRVEGTLEIADPSATIDGVITIHGKQLIISNSEPSPAQPNTVWIQTFGV